MILITKHHASVLSKLRNKSGIWEHAMPLKAAGKTVHFGYAHDKMNQQMCSLYR